VLVSNRAVPRVRTQRSKGDPNYLGHAGLLDILLRGQGLPGVLPEVAVLLGFSAIFLAIGVLRFRYE
jgi:hypothetical protein